MPSTKSQSSIRKGNSKNFVNGYENMRWDNHPPKEHKEDNFIFDTKNIWGISEEEWLILYGDPTKYQSLGVIKCPVLKEE